MNVFSAEELGKDYFIQETGDEGFGNQDVYRVLQKVMHTRKNVKGMKKIFRQHLTEDGVTYAITFTEEWIELGIWGFLKKQAISIRM